MSILITGHGRSGTLYLATMLNRSPSWTIEHEPQTNIHNMLNCAQHAKRFRKSHYGEVNGFLRYCLNAIPAEKKAIILRHPFELVASVYSLHKDDHHVTLTRIANWCKLAHGYAAQGLPLFYFERFTTDYRELERLAHTVGITDLEPKPEWTREKINTRPNRIPWEDLPKPVTKWARSSLQWFVDHYYGGTYG